MHYKQQQQTLWGGSETCFFPVYCSSCFYNLILLNVVFYYITKTCLLLVTFSMSIIPVFPFVCLLQENFHLKKHQYFVLQKLIQLFQKTAAYVIFGLVKNAFLHSICIVFKLLEHSICMTIA